MMAGLLGLLPFSCQDSPVFSNYRAIDKEAWYREDTIVMPVGQPVGECHGQGEQQLDMTVCVRYTDAFRYRNLSLLLEWVSEQRVVARDTLQFSMFNERDGVLGNGFGRYARTVRSMVALPLDKPYEVRIAHLMRLNPLCGITDVSFSLDSVRHPSSEK